MAPSTLASSFLEFTVRDRNWNFLGRNHLGTTLGPTDGVETAHRSPLPCRQGLLGEHLVAAAGAWKTGMIAGCPCQLIVFSHVRDGGTEYPGSVRTQADDAV